MNLLTPDGTEEKFSLPDLLVLSTPTTLGHSVWKGLSLYFINKRSGYFLLPLRENPSSLLTTGFGNIKSDGLSGKSKSEYLTVFETGKNGTQK